MTQLTDFEIPLRLQAALERLDHDLGNAGRTLETGGEQAGIQLAMAATIEFLRGISSRLGEPSKLAPFRKVLSGLQDLEDGVVPPLFKPKQVGPGRPETGDRRNLRACAAASMELLCKRGFSNSEASRIVAKELVRLKIPVGTSKNVTVVKAAKTIEQWRFKVYENADVFETYKTLLANAEISLPTDTVSLDQFRENVLGTLRAACVGMGLARRPEDSI